MITKVKGDLIKMAIAGEFDMIIHGCNCFHAMGAGIAKQIARSFPIAEQVDKQMTRRGDIKKLSEYTVAHIFQKLFVINLYTQYHPGPDFNIAALDLGLYKLTKSFNEIDKLRIGVPWIGCGIGGGNMQEVARVFDKYSSLNLTIVEYGN